MICNYISKYFFSKIFTDIFLDEMMNYLRFTSNEFGRLETETSLAMNWKLLKHSDEKDEGADFTVLYIFYIFETFHNNKVF